MAEGGRSSDNSLIDLAARALTDLALLKPARRDSAYDRANANLRELLDRLQQEKERQPEPLERIATVLEKWDRAGLPVYRCVQGDVYEALAKGMDQADAAAIGPSIAKLEEG